MNLLKNSKCYLVGPIELSNDPVSWRSRVTKELNEIGVKVYDPMVKPDWAPEVARETNKNVNNKNLFIEVMHKIGKGEELTKNDKDHYYAMNWIRDIDLRFVHSCDFIVCYLPKIFSVGSCEELTIAIESKKPVLIWSKDTYIPSSWLASMMCNEPEDIKDYFFHSEEDLVQYLKKVDNNEVPVDPLKWIFLSYFNKNLKIKGKRSW